MLGMAVFSVNRELYCNMIFAQKLFLSFSYSAILFLVVLTRRSESGIMKSWLYCIYVFVRIGLNFNKKSKRHKSALLCKVPTIRSRVTRWGMSLISAWRASVIKHLCSGQEYPLTVREGIMCHEKYSDCIYRVLTNYLHLKKFIFL